ncbi:N-acetyltransferase GCN5 [Vibrio cholerae]|nr:N-acetyltransferase GCN5 [Vibrio cholerae]
MRNMDIKLRPIESEEFDSLKVWGKDNELCP